MRTWKLQRTLLARAQRKVFCKPACCLAATRWQSMDRISVDSGLPGFSGLGLIHKYFSGPCVHHFPLDPNCFSIRSPVSFTSRAWIFVTHLAGWGRPLLLACLALPGASPPRSEGQCENAAQAACQASEATRPRVSRAVRSLPETLSRSSQ